VTEEIKRHYFAALAKISEKIGNGADPAGHVEAMMKITERLEAGSGGRLGAIEGRLTALETNHRNLQNKVNLKK